MQQSREVGNGGGRRRGLRRADSEGGKGRKGAFSPEVFVFKLICISLRLFPFGGRGRGERVRILFGMRCFGVFGFSRVREREGGEGSWLRKRKICEVFQRDFYLQPSKGESGENGLEIKE